MMCVDAIVAKDSDAKPLRYGYGYGNRYGYGYGYGYGTLSEHPDSMFCATMNFE